MKKVLAIGGSNSKTSINKIFATYIANQLENVEVEVVNWEGLVLPLYSPSLEEESGIPENALRFKEMIENADVIVLSLAEHNGLPTAAFKNLWDWTSRIDMKFWAEKPMFLAAASPGGRGGASVLQIVKDMMPHFAGNVVTDFSLPRFYDNFKNEVLIDEQLKKELNEKVSHFQQKL
ncbi:MAG: NAD(P)H-dependent FMN reductase [Flammeovirgaceae bacterium]|jgi:chromate reductase